MNNLIAPFLSDAYTGDDATATTESKTAVDNLSAFFDAGLAYAAKHDNRESLTPENIVIMRDAWIELVMSSVSVTEQTMMFAKENTDPSVVFLINLHREWHNKFYEPDEIVIWPTVHEDGLYFMFGDVRALVKAISFDRSVETTIIEVVEYADGQLEADMQNQDEGSTDDVPDGFQPICLFAKRVTIGETLGNSGLSHLLYALIGGYSPE